METLAITPFWLSVELQHTANFEICVQKGRFFLWLICYSHAKNARVCVSNTEKDYLDKILFLLLIRINSVAITGKVKKGNSAEIEQMLKVSGNTYVNLVGTEPGCSGWGQKHLSAQKLQSDTIIRGIFVVHMGVSLFPKYKEWKMHVFYQCNYFSGREVKGRENGKNSPRPTSLQVSPLKYIMQMSKITAWWGLWGEKCLHLRRVLPCE